MSQVQTALIDLLINETVLFRYTYFGILIIMMNKAT